MLATTKLLQKDFNKILCCGYESQEHKPIMLGFVIATENIVFVQQKTLCLFNNIFVRAGASHLVVQQRGIFYIKTLRVHTAYLFKRFLFRFSIHV